jgi:hypothetical protein
MGGACSSESNMEGGESNMKDLPGVDLKGKDAYEKFEISLPFSKILIKDFVHRVNQAHLADGN